MNSLRSKFKCFHLLWLLKYAEKQIQQNKSGLLSVWREFKKLHASLFCRGFPGGSVEESAYQCRRRGFNPWIRKISWRRKWQSNPGKKLENSRDGGAWQSAVQGIHKRVRYNLGTKQQQLFCRYQSASFPSTSLFYHLNMLSENSLSLNVWLDVNFLVKSYYSIDKNCF